MDYSLMIFKVDHSGYLSNIISDENWRQSANIHVPVEAINNQAGFSIIESNTDPGVFYHFGIIDYLQRYNL